MKEIILTHISLRIYLSSATHYRERKEIKVSLAGLEVRDPRVHQASRDSPDQRDQLDLMDLMPEMVTPEKLEKMGSL